METKDFRDLTYPEITEVLVNLSHNHLKQEKNGKILKDYSKTFELWSLLVRYVTLNHDNLKKDYNIAGTYGQMTEQLLVLRAVQISKTEESK